MNCQQKSGVFLNINCSNTKKNKCSNCDKDVCEIHSHILESKYYCEDCFWERFLYTIEVRDHYDNDTFTESNTMSTSNSRNETDSGFGGGFGGGGFGGGGASSEWTEGDIQSLDTNNSNNAAEGLLLDTDDTFFYS